MNWILNTPANDMIQTCDLDHEFVEEYHLTLKQYSAYQLAVMIENKTHKLEFKEYIIKHTHTYEENLDFRNGVNDAFCEIVKAGVKKLAFSHATDDEYTFALEFHSAYHCAKKYGIHFYVEESLVETLLFKNSGSHVIIFYKDEQDIEDYKLLKYNVLNTKNPDLLKQKEFAKELGRLLSYNPLRVEEMIESNLEK